MSNSLLRRCARERNLPQSATTTGSARALNESITVQRAWSGWRLLRSALSGNLRRNELSCKSVAVVARMQNPFAIAVRWPDEPRRYLVHLQRPYFTAALLETAGAAWLLVSWAPGANSDEAARMVVLRSAADFCRRQLDQGAVPIEFVERRGGFQLPQYLIAETTAKELFIVEPEHWTPLVEVRDSDPSPTAKNRPGHRFDVVTQWRLAQMRKYYHQYLERQNPRTTVPAPAVLG